MSTYKKIDGVLVIADPDSVEDLKRRLSYIESRYDSYHADVSLSSEEWVNPEFFAHAQSDLRKEAAAIRQRLSTLEGSK